MQTSLRGIANRAQKDQKAQFQDLYRLLNVDNLRECFKRLNKKAAAGVDKVTYADYEQDLEDNLQALVERLKQKRYKAKLVRRKYIPKPNGKRRPLGIPALEDKLLQLAVTKILSAIYEQDFLDNSWGYRPNRGPRQASRILGEKLTSGAFWYVVEADIRGFYDNISHDWLIKMLELRIDDKNMIRLIKKWLKAGVLDENKQVIHPATGTPQGGIVSPVLANVYLHYALDLWFKEIVQKQSQGAAYMMRFADDFVCAFQYKKDAEQFMKALPGRLAKFNLEVAEEKTRMLKFGPAEQHGSESFDFLGFEFRWVRRGSGKMGVQRRTSRKKLRASIQAFSDWIKCHRDCRLGAIMTMVSAKLRGYWQYYGVLGNYRSLRQMYRSCFKLLFKWLNRRSQRRSYTGPAFRAMVKHFALPQPRIMELPSRGQRCFV